MGGAALAGPSSSAATRPTGVTNSPVTCPTPSASSSSPTPATARWWRGTTSGPRCPPDASWSSTTRPATWTRPAARTTPPCSPVWPAHPCPTRRRGGDRGQPRLLLFTSGTSGAPKACLCSQGRLARIGAIVARCTSSPRRRLLPVDAPLPLQRADGRLGPALAAGATAALRERFSASQFLVDVRRYGVTYFNYVGKPSPTSWPPRSTRRRRQHAAPLLRQRGGRGRRGPLRRAVRLHRAGRLRLHEGGAAIQRTPDTRVARSDGRFRAR